MEWRSYVAVGDSFTEGMDDPYPDGGIYRGWADLVATRLAAEAGPDFQYANLAIRGRRFDGVVAEQVPAALEMRPDLISFAAGGNDILRRNVDLPDLVNRFDKVIGKLRDAGADVIVFRFSDAWVTRLPGQRITLPRGSALNRVVEETAAARGATLVNLNEDADFHNPRMWSIDRLHLSAIGHQRVAAHVLTALGVGCDEEWLLVPPRPEPTPWLAARAADLRWAGRYLAPWIKRRLTGRSSGDGIAPKRPQLAPVE
ncbi:SGNH/GDSL hydrolase family protein [Phytohabitans rumicis]|uniref:SGNH hydrolase n=1 Tax=Phytohabitans rumicis TaxID=1076125 RepID=A0A6V8L320_9ACTN|nr:SGNH/GDSL hydrolase family protein [Phytohabitans rumicis]GFJ90554.1 SGNH hydrolase [Phytohabitans rumicis]